jgi:hypothetical protein
MIEADTVVRIHVDVCHRVSGAVLGRDGRFPHSIHNPDQLLPQLLDLIPQFRCLLEL